MMEEALCRVWIKYAALLSTIPGLKEEQRLIIQAILAGQDTFVSLSTGFGKSLIYILLPLIADELEDGVKHLAVIVSPLLSIINEQVRKLQAAGIKAHAITSESDPTSIKDVKAGNTQVVFVTPECVGIQAWRETFRSLLDQITVLCIDECHCITTWGRKFRWDYRRLGEMCAFISCPVLFLTGTATPFIKNDVLGVFGMDACNTISRKPDRENLRLFIEYVPHNETCLQWLLDYFIEHGVHGKKVVVFTTSIREASKIFMWLLDNLLKAGKAYTGDIKSVDHRIVDMYHSKASGDCEDRVRDDFPMTNSTVRLLVSTIKMGMGVDIKDIDAVILYGAPAGIMDLWQEIGRCSRGQGRMGLAVVYLTGTTLGACKDKRIHELKDLEECKRKTILDSFSLDGVSHQDAPRENT